MQSLAMSHWKQSKLVFPVFMMNTINPLPHHSINSNQSYFSICLGMPFDSPLGSFLLPPFRKPKRIRTAFSPGQLLKLEQAFEKNHYVVGNERKQLANHLGLSETQVKVWFQNRRTKHKRQKQEDEESGTGSINNGENGNANKDYSDDEEEEIDLEDEECVSDQEHDNQALKFANMHHLWYQSMSAGLMGDNPPVTSASSN